MTDYSLGKIYKLVSSNGNLCYIGSTTKTLTVRLSEHKCNYKRWKAGKYSFVTSFKVLEDETEAIIELLERYPCDSRKELEKAERKYIESNKCVNKIIVGRTDKQYRDDNKDKLKEYRESHKDSKKLLNKQYYETNKDVLNAKNTCECGGKYAQRHKSTHFKSIKHQSFVKQQSESD